ncbi:MAG: tetratricopeptide repeat protein [Myxococcales bacterium]|nr:tetratricopeptide repeat protein [Myxococcales bacterium]
MHACPSCGSALDASRPTPPHCPYCGASLTSTGFGAPPGFAGTPGESGVGAIFVPEDSTSGMERPTLQAPRRRQPPPPPPSGAPSGPPSIGLDEMRHNELDLGGGSGGGSLELDFGGTPGRPPAAEPPPAIDMPDDFGLSEPSLYEPDADLPSPVTTPRDPAVDLPTPVIEPRGVTSNLPRPVAGPRGRGGPPRPPPARAAPMGPPPAGPPPADDYELDLPVPVDEARAAAMGPAFDEGLPEAVELDLPLAEGGVSIDAGFDDLPIPADLPAPSSGQDLRPAYGNQDLRPAYGNQDLRPAYGNQDLRPAELGVTPANLDVAPANLDVRPKLAGNELAPGDLPQPRMRGHSGPGMAMQGPPVAGAPGVAGPPMPGPTPGMAVAPRAAAPRPAVSRGVLYLVGGLLVLGLAGAGVLYSGLLDPDEPQPSAGRGVKKKQPEGEDGGKAAADDGSETPPPTALAERSHAVLAIMAKHTPEAYLQARAEASEAGDTVGAAEAALLLSYHYGPNPALTTEAGAALQPHVAETAPFVQRVIGLASLVAGNLDGAAKALGTGDDDLRTRLYRGWLHLERGELDEAAAEAKAVRDALADEISARHLGLAVEAERDPVAALPEIQAAVEGTPSHAGLQALLAQTALRTGQLVLARRAIDAIDPEGTDDLGVQSWSFVQRARVRLAQGDEQGALADYDAALERIAEQPPVQMERIRALVQANRLNDASSAVSALVREHPQDLEIQLLQAEVAVASGDIDIALQVLGTLAPSLPEDPRVLITKGKAHTMRLEVDEGQADFAAARKLDPASVDAAVGEAVLLGDAKQLPEALAVLEAARTAAEADGRSQDQARLLVAKAELHEAAGERNAALAALDRALEVAPDDNRAQIRRGALRVQEGRLAEGRSDLVAVFERTGGFPGLAAPLGRLYVAEGDFDALERLVGDRLRGDQTADDLLTIGARLRLQQGRTEEARALIEAALARRPADWEAHMLMSQVLIAEGKPVDALVEIERARPSRPEPELMLVRGKILEFNGKHDDALPEYRRALSLQPELHEARFLLGRKLVYDGANGKGITELRKVADAPEARGAPWYPEVWVNIGIAQHALGKYAEAIASLREATSIDPKHGFAYAEEGRFHEFRNKHAEAIAALQKAVELGTPEDHWYADALMDLARAQSKSGKGAAAKKTAERFLEVASPEHVSRAEAERLARG